MAQQGSSRALRPIAPRTAPAVSVPATSGSTEDSNGRAKRASMACTECKRRRTKCSYDTTGNPCHECALQGCECIVDESADRRRKAASRHTQEQLEYYRDFLHQVFQAVREGDNATVDAIVYVIRSGASDNQIQEVVLQSLVPPVNHSLVEEAHQTLIQETHQTVISEIKDEDEEDGIADDGTEMAQVSNGIGPAGTMPYFPPDGWR